MAYKLETPLFLFLKNWKEPHIVTWDWKDWEKKVSIIKHIHEFYPTLKEK